MGKRGKKLDEKTQAEIIRLSKEYGPRYVAQHLGLHESTVRRHIELDLEAKVMASRSFQEHIDDIARTLKEIVKIKRTDLMYAAITHFTGEYPEYARLMNCHDIIKEAGPLVKNKEAGPILKNLELFANSRSFKFCAKCPICQNIKRGLRKSA